MNDHPTSLDWSYVQRQAAHLECFSSYRSCMTVFNDFKDWPTALDLTSVFRQIHPDSAINFVRQEIPSKRNGERKGALETYISRFATHREVLTRERHLHDFCNFLTFVLFPLTKSRLFDLHFDEEEDLKTQGESAIIDKSKGGRGRTRLQDKITLFDEGGSIYLGPGRPLLLFGHGVLEQAIKSPCVITTYALRLESKVISNDSCHELDRKMFEIFLNKELLFTKELFGSETIDLINDSF